MTATDPDRFTDPGLQVQLRERSLAWREVAEEVIALDLGTSRYHAVNGSGRVLWKELAGGTSVAALRTALVRAYPAAQPSADTDVARFLADLDARCLIEVGASPGSGG